MITVIVTVLVTSSATSSAGMSKASSRECLETVAADRGSAKAEF